MLAWGENRTASSENCAVTVPLRTSDRNVAIEKNFCIIMILKYYLGRLLSSSLEVPSLRVRPVDELPLLSSRERLLSVDCAGCVGAGVVTTDVEAGAGVVVLPAVVCGCEYTDGVDGDRSRSLFPSRVGPSVLGRFPEGTVVVVVGAHHEFTETVGTGQ